MADHVRTQIRDRMVTLIGTTATAGSSVITNRVYDIDRLSLPTISVEEGNESREPITMPAPRLFDVRSEFDVTIFVEDNADCEKSLDGIAKEIETALAMPVSGPWKCLTQIQSGQRLDGSAQKIRGTRILRYRADYLIRENAPDTAL
jgi:hypothetical protein